VDGEYALPAAGTSGEDEEPGLAVCSGFRKHAHARPVGVAEACRAFPAGIERRMNTERKKEESEDDEEHFANGVHGVE